MTWGKGLMDGVLCSTNFQKFFKNIISASEGLAEFISALKENIPLISREVSIGRLNFEASEEFTLEELGMDDRRATIFTEPYYNSANVTQRRFKSHDNGNVLIEIYPTSGHVWNDAEGEALNFLLQVLFTICAKTRAFSEVHKVAVTDQLTGVLNRQGLADYCEKNLLFGIIGQYTAVFLNIRNFKYINQVVGTRAADKILTVYAHKLEELAGEGAMVARLGGDNFIIFVKDEHAEEFVWQTEAVSVSSSGYANLTLSAKAGVYKIGMIDTMNDILNFASIAYTEAKNSKSDRVCYFNAEMYKKNTAENEITAYFPKAMENNEFQVYFQPKVRMDTGRLCGCEALVRWDRAGILVQPSEFVPVLEQTGDVCYLDFYMLDGTCRCIRYWLDNNIAPVRVSVNFSKIHLRNPDLADDICAVLEKHNVPPRYIEIELTETSCSEDFGALLRFINEMRSRGFKISIDDFGTGYSSLNMLKDMHVDVIKLDKSFVDSIDEPGESAKIVVRNIVKTILELGMEVIAEGVEKISQVNFLEEIGCEMAQGYRFGKPMEAGRFTNELISDMR